MEDASVKHILRKALGSHQALRDRCATWLHTHTVMSAGPGCAISRNVSIRNAESIRLGTSVVIKDGAILNGRTHTQRPGISLGDFSYIREYAYIDSYGGWIEMEDYVAIGQFSVFDGEGGLSVGRYTMIGSHVYIIGSNHRFDSLELPYKLQGNSAYGIDIGPNVWIGGGSIILDGVSIGRNAVIAAGSIVTKSVAANTIHVDTAPRELGLRLRSGLYAFRDLDRTD
jgi:acetyltransferase-like isoleucine patch superfamily enzyme